MNATMSTVKNGPVDGRPARHSGEQEHIYVGLDKTGAMHHYDTKCSRIVVIKSGAIEHVERFDDAEDRDLVVTEWMDFIADRRGWEEVKFVTQHQFWDSGVESGFKRLSELMEVR